MQIIQHSQKNVFLISGMFAGNWIWSDCYKNINGNINMMVEPLCNIGEDIESLSQDIAKAVNQLSGKVVLIGNSLGSLICLKIASILGDKVELVVISGSAGFGDFPFDLKLRRTDPDSMRPQLTNLLCHDPKKAIPENMDKVISSFAKNFKPIVKLIKASNLNLADKLIPQVKAKIVAIWGDDDKITPFSGVKDTLDNHGIDYYLIDKCGHSPMYERPNEFAQAVNICLT